MSDALQAYLAEGGPVAGGDYAGLQRLAMQDILRLSPEQVGPIESLIESQYQALRKDILEQFEADKREIEVNFRPQLEQIQRRHEADIQAVQADYEKQKQALDLQTEQRRLEISRLASERHRQADQQRQDQVMEAEFLIEGTLEKAKQKRKKAQIAAQTVRRRLEDLRQQADEQMRLYHEPVPDWDNGSLSAEPIQGRPGPAYHEQEALARRHLEDLRKFRMARFLGGLRFLSKGSGGPVRDTYAAFQQALTRAAAALEQKHRGAQQRMETRFGTLIERGKAELRRVRQNFEEAESQILEQRRAALAQLEQTSRQAHDRLVERRDKAIQEAQEQYRQDRSRWDRLIQEEMVDVRQRHDLALAKAEEEHLRRGQALQERWDRGLDRVDALLTATSGLDPMTVGEMETVLRDRWTAPRATPPVVRFGLWRMDLGRLAGPVLSHAGPRSKGYGPVTLPAVLALPGRGSLLIQHEREGRTEAIEALRAVMVRLFTSLPPGQVRFTLVDPLGLGQSFAGFMHAGDYRESLVGGRIWTEVVEIQQQLEDLTNHMEDVIQKYLRNEFETIEEYNRQAGPLAEPYRFLVMADFPTHINEESARRLASIVHSGPRCGVHTLIAYDSRQELPGGIDLKDIREAGPHGGEIRVAGRHPATLPPDPRQAPFGKGSDPDHARRGKGQPGRLEGGGPL